MIHSTHFVITARRTVTDPAERARRLGRALSYILSLAHDEKRTPTTDKLTGAAVIGASGTAQTFRPEHQDYITEAVA